VKEASGYFANWEKIPRTMFRDTVDLALGALAGGGKSAPVRSL
jgi:hypothetical protein